MSSQEEVDKLLDELKVKSEVATLAGDTDGANEFTRTISYIRYVMAERDSATTLGVAAHEVLSPVIRERDELKEENTRLTALLQSRNPDYVPAQDRGYPSSQQGWMYSFGATPGGHSMPDGNEMNTIRLMVSTRSFDLYPNEFLYLLDQMSSIEVNYRMVDHITAESLPLFTEAMDKWFSETFNNELLGKMVDKKIIAQALGFRLSIKAYFDIAVRNLFNKLTGKVEE